jgi:transposase
VGGREEHMDVETLRASMAKLAAQLDRERAAARSTAAAAAQRISELEKERDNLRASHERLRQELELWKRRLFVAKAERADNERQLALEFAEKMRQLDELAGTLGIAENKPAADDEPARDGKPKGERARGRGTGRRDLRTLPLEEERIELPDPHLEKLVEEGKIVRHGFEESAKLLFKRGGKRRVIIARVRYKAVDRDGNTDVITAAMPPEMIPSAIAAPSLMAHILVENIAKGMPLFRLEESFDRDGIGIDRGTMSRWKKQIGERLAQTIVLAMHKHALATAFCIATDATGVNVQPIYSQQKGRQPCQKSHFLVMAADRDHLLYEYLEKENGRAIYTRFRGFDGYVQSDAKSVFNLLFADPAELAAKAPDLEHDDCSRSEVGCWYHNRRRYWEAAVAKSAVGREGLVRIGRIFELDESWKKKPPSEIKRLREQHLRPHVDSFFAWVDEQRALYKNQRGYARSALEYTSNQREALMRFFEDGKLVLTNNGAERALKTIATGRKAWLFCGSDDHARSTAALFSIVASARLHGLDLEEYLRCLIRLVPLWPEDRMLELAPLFWSRTRARLDDAELEAEIGWLTIPPPLDTSASTEQPASS